MNEGNMHLVDLAKWELTLKLLMEIFQLELDWQRAMKWPKEMWISFTQTLSETVFRIKVLSFCCRFFAHQCLWRPWNGKQRKAGFHSNDCLTKLFLFHFIKSQQGHSHCHCLPISTRPWPVVTHMNFQLLFCGDLKEICLCKVHRYYKLDSS